MMRSSRLRSSHAAASSSPRAASAEPGGPERLRETADALEGAHSRRRERARRVREACATLERPPGEPAVEQAGRERVACAGAVHGDDRDRGDVALELVAGQVATVGAERDGGLAGAELPQAGGGAGGLVLTRDRARLRKAGSDEVAVRQRRQDALPPAARVEGSIE